MINNLLENLKNEIMKEYNGELVEKGRFSDEYKFNIKCTCGCVNEYYIKVDNNVVSLANAIEQIETQKCYKCK